MLKRPAILLLSAMLLTTACTTTAMPLSAQAQTQPVSDAQSSIKAVENYLQNLHTLRAKFVQTAPDGSKTNGEFLLKRPGRMRFDYAAPVTDFIVADGRFIYYYDGQMRETSNAPISHSLADFFLREKISLNGDIKVTDVQSANGLLLLTLVQSKDPGAGSLTIGLTQGVRLQLKKWIIRDTQGSLTEVELFDTAEGITLDSDQFHYYDPKRRDRDYN